jgi:serine/threonine protein kinase
MAESSDFPADDPGRSVASSPNDEDATRIQPRLPAAISVAPSSVGSATLPPARMSILRPGQLLAHTYEIEALVARGGMGEVYRARHIDVGSRHAIKVILPELANNPAIINMFTEEARKLRMVRDDAVVAYDGMFRDENGLRYLVMEYADGLPLSRAMREAPLRPEDVLRLRDRLAQGLGAAHAREIYHRDISPDNIILVDGRVDRAKIIDFGIAKAGAAGEHTIIGSDFAGKYSYVAPEQLGMFGGAVDGRSDLYSLGLVLAAAALGRPLPMGNSPASAIEARGRVPDLSALPEELRGELAPLLEPDPARRPGSVRELQASLLAKSPRQESTGSHKHRTPFVIGASALGLLVVIGAFAYYARVLPSPPSFVQSTGAKLSSGSNGVTSLGVEPQQAALPAAPTQPPPLDTSATKAVVGEIVDKFSNGLRCSDLKTRFADDGALEVNGFISSEGNSAILRDELQAVPGIRALRTSITAYVGQHCDVIKLLEDSGALARQAKPRLEFNIPSLTYRAGDKLVVRATPASDGYLYVDFYDGAGQVVHLRPGPQQRNEIVKTGQVVTLGSDKPVGNQAVYEISEPYGPNLVVAISSRVPLFDLSREAVERAQPYLSVLGKALAQRDRALAAGDFTVIETIPR